MLDVGCWMLVAGCCKPFPSWEGPGVGFKVQSSKFKIQGSKLDVGCWSRVVSGQLSVVSGRTLNVGPLSPLRLLNVSTSPIQRTSPLRGTIAARVAAIGISPLVLVQK